MFRTLVEILNRPFPIVESTKEKLIIAISFGVFIFAFLAVFQPFGLNKITTNKLLYFSGYGLITSIVILFNAFVIMNIFKEFFLPENWRLWKSFVHNFIIIIPIAALNWFYFILTESPGDLSHSFLNFIFMTIAVGFFPSLILTYYLEQKLRNRNKNFSEKVNKILPLNNSESFKDEKSNFTLPNLEAQISVNDLICIKSMGNYVAVYFIIQNKIKREIIRSTMKAIENYISENHKIVRCHKSYFVNINRVVTTSGNARALYLHIEDLDFQIPVSRNYSKEFILKSV